MLSLRMSILLPRIVALFGSRQEAINEICQDGGRDRTPRHEPFYLILLASRDIGSPVSVLPEWTRQPRLALEASRRLSLSGSSFTPEEKG